MSNFPSRSTNSRKRPACQLDTELCITEGMSNKSNSSNKSSWVKRFCSLDGNDFLCEVDREYLVDRFNTTGLDELVPLYRQSYDIIIDKVNDQKIDQLGESEDDSSYLSKDEYNRKIVRPTIFCLLKIVLITFIIFFQQQILSSAEVLYGLIHARFIITDSGLHKMRQKYVDGKFGKCSRFFCDQASLLPIGLSDKPSEQSLRLYCPRCMDIYLPQHTKYISIDGAYFGTNFPHMFFMVFPESRPTPPSRQFVPSLYGFRIHPLAYEFQQKQSAKRACPMQLTGKGEAKCNGDHHNHKAPERPT